MPKKNTGAAISATRRNSHNFRPATWGFTGAAGSFWPLAAGVAGEERLFLRFFATLNSGSWTAIAPAGAASFADTNNGKSGCHCCAMKIREARRSVKENQFRLESATMSANRSALIVQCKHSNGHIPLHLAIESRSWEIVHLLVNSGGNSRTLFVTRVLRQSSLLTLVKRFLAGLSLPHPGGRFFGFNTNGTIRCPDVFCRLRASATIAFKS